MARLVSVAKGIAAALGLFLLGSTGPQLAAAQTRGGSTSFGADQGLRYASPDLAWHLGALLGVDWVEYGSDNTRDSGARVDLAWLLFDGSLHETLGWRLALDMEGTETRYGMDEAHVFWQPSPALRLTVGLQDIPLGVEAGIREEDLPFIGHGFALDLDGRTDWGIRAEGELREGLFSWDLALAIGWGFDRFGQERDDPQISARVTVYPFRWASRGDRLIDGLFGGLGYAWSPSYRDELDVGTPLRNKVFNLPELRAGGSRFAHLSLGWDAGPVRLMGETLSGSLLDVETPVGERDFDDQIKAWQASITWMISGERYDSRPFRQRAPRAGFPLRPVNASGAARGLGAWEIGFRYANGDIDRDFFALGLTTSKISSQEFRTRTFVLNWYPTAQLRVSLEVVDTNADDEPATFETDSNDTSALLRAQYRF